MGFSIVAAVVGGLLQLKGQQDQKKAAKKAEKAREAQFAAEQRIAEAKNTRAIREELRKARAARSMIINTGATSGTAGSSGVQGGAGSVVSQSGVNISDFGTIRQGQIAAGQAQVAYGSAMGQMAQAQALGSLGGTIFNTAGGFGTIFGQTQPGQGTNR